MKKKIVVLMSAYNGEKYIRKQLDSILNQTIADSMDIIVRDDGSKDSTCEILKEYQQQNDNFYYIKGENIGLNASFFELLKKAGDYMYYAFSDQDDIWFNDKLEIGVKELESKNNCHPLLYGSCSLLVDDDGNELGITQQKHREITIRNVLFQNFLPGHSQIFNQSLKVLLESIPNCEELYVYDSWVTLCACVFGEIIFDNQYHTYYIQHGDNAYGYGEGIINWIKMRLKRLKKGETKLIKEQNRYFYNIYSSKIPVSYQGIFKDTVQEKNLISRIRYLLKYKPYRQKKIETLLLYYLILMNKY